MILDISKYQGNVRWNELKEYADFVILKASGKTKDNKFDENANGALQYGVPFHVYHFLYCTTVARAKVEAKMFSDAVGNNKPLFWVLDCEKESGITAAKARTVVEAFEEELKKIRGNDIRVAIYIAHELYKSWALDYSRYAYVWIPRYGKNTGTIDGSIRPNYPCDLWQYTSKGRVFGIDGDVDMSVINGDKKMEFFTCKTDETKETDKKPGKQPDIPTKETFLGKRTLKKGCVGEDVKELQQGLTNIGISVGRYGVDGDYGTDTKKGVIIFQRMHGLKADGIFGPQSFAKWKEVI